MFALLGGNGWNRNNNNGYDVAAGIANGSFTRDHVSNEFDFSDMKNGIRGVCHVSGSNSVKISCPGTYLVAFNADILATDAGPVTVELLNNGVEVPGAEATFTAVANDTTHIAFTTLIHVNKSCECVCNNSNLQIRVSVDSTVTNANIVVTKLY